ncbi:hypothetical protein FisN_14Hh369 [Fistulifera solaris]|jgi:uncharacterized membrane protein YdjX (TVP38/TMEM64 family)|uniref:VTT domain-containing protein n=1 Tax=Fistulifera solaris TaxID=1519565 RepID=A0A1Z5KBE0_FISSO|nr:hypothetical protein FisN_14Hh369 [Fistulifera solaris]|eukprot:GAX23462.1 hypothetical protein FisN_14Hh369 [Fistulifera solaris]
MSSFKEENNNSKLFRIQTEIRDLVYELMDFFRHRSWKKKVLTILMMACSLYVILDLLFLGTIVQAIQAYGKYLATHLIRGTWLYIAVLILAALVMIPPLPILFMGGYIYSTAAGAWGVALVFFASLFGCTVGAVLALFRSRYMMRDLVTLFAKRYRIIRAIHRTMSRHGFRVFLLLRLCPVVPFNALNHIAGSTDITVEQFLYSLVGIIPMTLLTVVAGATAEQMVYAAEDPDAVVYSVRILLIVAGLGFCIGAVISTAYVARQELRKELAWERMIAQTGGGRINNDAECLDHVSIEGNVTEDDDSMLRLDLWSALEDVEMTSDGYKLYPDGTRVKECDEEDWIWLFP